MIRKRSMINTARIKQIFVELAKTITNVIATGNLTPELGPARHAFIQHSGFVLQGFLANEFFEATAAAAEVVETDAAWGKEAIQDLFARHLAPFILNKTDASHISVAAADLLKDLSKPATTFEKRLSVFGLDAAISDLEFGAITIVREEYVHYGDFGTFLKKDVPQQFHFAVITVHTIDDQTAGIKSRQILDRHLAVMNALCSDKYPSSFRLTHNLLGPMDLRISGSRRPDGRFSGNVSSMRANLSIDTANIQKGLATPTGKRASKLMVDNSEVASRIIAAYEMAGSACMETNTHTAFVLFAIALESSVLGQGNQLATRSAHLIAYSLKDRQSVSRQVRKLYTTRSQIVHTGKTDITPSDVEEIRRVCLTCLGALSGLVESAAMKTHQQLEDWLEIKTLESSDLIVDNAS
jgi:hypothetical protein